jgi:uncharacterized protein (UPF0297 family)
VVRFGIITVITGFLLAMAVLWVNAKGPSPHEFIQNDDVQNEVNNVFKRMEETELTNQIVDALEENGYNPSRHIAGEIYSADKKVLIIFMRGLNGKVKENKARIQSIVNQVSEMNHLGTFDVRIIEVD